MDTEAFFNVNTGAALSFSVLPKNEVVGVGASVKDDPTKIVATQICCVSMKARDLPDSEAKRAPVDIIVALDASGSMEGQKLHLCKRTLEMFLRVLLPHDRFGLISYGSDARVEIPAQLMTAKNKEDALKKITSLKTRGCTNISAAVGLATQEMHTIETPNDVRSIFLLTDGLTNEGISDTAGLVELTKNCLDCNDDWIVDFDEPLGLDDGWSYYCNADQDMSATRTEGKGSPAPISFYTFGYGLDHDATLLQEMASSTTGSYYFVEDDMNIGSAFGDAIGGILSVVAQNAVVTIKVPPAALALGVGITEIFHNQVVKRENGSYTVNVGDFYAEEERDVLFEVKLATPTSPTNKKHPIPHATISLAYTDILEKRLVRSDNIACTIIRPMGTEISEENTHIVAQWWRVHAAHQMAQAEKLASQKRFGEAKASLQQFTDECSRQSAQVQAFPATATLSRVLASIREVENSLNDEDNYERKGSKLMSSMIRSHVMQRSTSSLLDHNIVYKNKRKADFSSTFSLRAAVSEDNVVYKNKNKADGFVMQPLASPGSDDHVEHKKMRKTPFSSSML